MTSFTSTSAAASRADVREGAVRSMAGVRLGVPPQATTRDSRALMNLPRTFAPSLLACLVALVALVVPASPAAAHAGLVGSDPADAATLAEAPQQVTLTFSEEVREPAYVFVTGPDGRTHETGEVEVVGAVTTQAVEVPEQSAGDWSIAYRVVSSDGHPISGQLTFTVESDGSPTSAPSATPSDESTATPSAEPTATPTTEPGPDSAADSEADSEGNGGAPYVLASILAVLLVTVAAFVTRRKREQK